MPSPRRLVALMLTCLAVACASTATTSSALASTPEVDPTPGTNHVLGADGTTEPVYDFADAIIEHVYVETSMDSDRDGRLDLVRADIIRPNTADGDTVPSIITASGYYGTPGGKPYVDDANRDTSDLLFMPDIYDNYFVPRGYAFLSVDVAGTNWSEGCVDDVGPNDIESVAAVIRWLHHGDARAYRNLDRAEEVAAPWSSGHSAVTGVSYDGGIANAVATADDVPGLETVIPLEGGSSAYNTRPNGVYVGGGTAEFSQWLTNPEPEGTENPELPLRLREHQWAKLAQCQSDFDAMKADSDPVGRTYNAFWQARNFTDKVDKIAANGVSVFIGAGQGDMIVRTNEFARHWAALRAAGVSSKLWLHLRGHIDAFAADEDTWMSDIHRWLDHELLGVDNGIDTEPDVRVEVAPDTWERDDTWPVTATDAGVALPGTSKVLHFGGADATTVGDLAPTVPVAGEASFVGAQLVDSAPFALTESSATPFARADRLSYVTQPFDVATRISGTPSVTLRVKATAGDMNVSVALVDYGGGTYVDWGSGPGVQDVPGTEKQWDGASPFEAMIIPLTQAVTADSGSYVFTRGTGNTAHYQTLEAYTPAPIDAFVDLTWDLMPLDHTIPAGHRLGLVVFNNSIQFDPATVGDYVGTAGATVDLASSTITVPMTVSPRSDWEAAVPPTTPPTTPPTDPPTPTGPADPSSPSSDPSAASGAGSGVSGSLAHTGMDQTLVPLLGAVSVTAVLAGAGLLLVRRRRHHDA